MAKKKIDVMDTSFRDGFQSVFGGRVLLKDFLPALEASKEIGITHYEFGGGARFQAPLFYLNEDPFYVMDKFREVVGKEANLQTLSRGINTVALDTGSRELIDLHAKLFAKHGTTTIRNFDALNDIDNMEFSAKCIVNHGLKHELVVTMMDLPPGIKTDAHQVPFYEKTLRTALDRGIKFTSVCFKDASGTSSPRKVFETIKMARKLLPEGTHIRMHTHETAGVSVACYMAALEAGADGIDLACAPVSGGTSQPDMIIMLHALKGMDYDLGLDIEKVSIFEEVFKDTLKDYFMPPEATQVSPMIPFSPMPGGALTANTQMMRDNDILDKYPAVIKEMREVVSKGGFGTSVTPVSQFYFQQAFNNVIHGKWNQIADGYGRMVLGYFGKTPVEPDKEVVRIASEQLKLPPTKENPLDIADKDEKKKLVYWTELLKKEDIKPTEENLFIAASSQQKGIMFLQGKCKASVRKISDEVKETKATAAPEPQLGPVNNFNIAVNGRTFNLKVNQIG